MYRLDYPVRQEGITICDPDAFRGDVEDPGQEASTFVDPLMDNPSTHDESKGFSLLIKKVCVDTGDGTGCLAKRLNGGVFPSEF